MWQQIEISSTQVGMYRLRRNALLAAAKRHFYLLIYAIIFSVALGAIAQQAPASSGSAPASAFRVDAKPVSAADLVPAGLYDLLPQDEGLAGLKQSLLRLSNTARMVHTDAHPDDEDGGMLALESRGHGVKALLLTLNRGEGGQNKLSSNLFDELGMVRTLELLAADRYYNVEQRFTRVADFGFSKSATETFDKWHGHDVALADMVRVIRSFRPDVIVSRFQGSKRDGHGHHEAAGILSREAFRAAADAKRFPEQIAEGLPPWQAQKLYVDNVRENEDWTLRLDTGEDSPALGMGYRQFAVEGLRHQLSQGAGSWNVGPGTYYSYYKLVDSVIPSAAGPDGHEKDFFDGIDTTYAGIAKYAGAQLKAVLWLPESLKQLQMKIDEANAAVDRDQRATAAAVFAAQQISNDILARIATAQIPAVSRNAIAAHLPARADFDNAERLALTWNVKAKIERPVAENAEIIVPGQKFVVTAEVPTIAGVTVNKVSVLAPNGWSVRDLDGNAAGKHRFEVTAPADAEYSGPYFHRNTPEKDTVYTVDDPDWLTLPMIPPPLKVNVQFSIQGETGQATLQEIVRADTILDGKTRSISLAVAPSLAVLIEPVTEVVPVGTEKPIEIAVMVRGNIVMHGGELHLDPPPGWRVEPAVQTVSIETVGQQKRFRFYVIPDADTQTQFRMRVGLEYQGRLFEQGYSVVSRPDLGVAYYYQPAVQRISVVSVKLPKYLHIGYIMGAGDDIPTVLRQVGMDLKIITPEEIASGDLSKYGTIVVGIRAYDTRDDVRKNNKRLLDYVSNGGTLVVQYNASFAEFNSGNYLPYPATLSRDRVTDENAPVTLLDEKDFTFDFPNDIVPADFHDWVQERGLYFFNEWDSRYVPLLSSHDPGEEPMKGGLLKASYGHGYYVYCSYAFFRQLPAGVPGAVRLFVNIVSTGHDLGR